MDFASYLLKRAGVNSPTILGKTRYQRKRDVMRSHGFRKFFITQCDKAHVSYTVREYISGHKLPNMDASYIRTTEEDRLADYVKAIPLLTIDPTQRLEKKVQDLESEREREIAELKTKLELYQTHADFSLTEIRKVQEQVSQMEDVVERWLSPEYQEEARSEYMNQIKRKYVRKRKADPVYLLRKY
jgi:type I site-specific restriction endonuclease